MVALAQEISTDLVGALQYAPASLLQDRVFEHVASQRSHPVRWLVTADGKWIAPP